jgi:hypothetical protein
MTKLCDGMVFPRAQAPRRFPDRPRREDNSWPDEVRAFPSSDTNYSHVPSKYRGPVRYSPVRRVAKVIANSIWPRAMVGLYFGWAIGRSAFGS